MHVFRRVRGADGVSRDEWLMMKRAPNVRVPGAWQMVSGRIEEGEKAYETAIREMREETGLEALHFFQASFVNRFYLAAEDQIILTPVFAAEVAAVSKVQLSEEHTEFRWVGPEEARAMLAWPGQRESLDVVREQFILGEPRAESRLDHLLQGPSPTAAPAKASRRR